jgi:hypothetical protein
MAPHRSYFRDEQEHVEALEEIAQRLDAAKSLEELDPTEKLEAAKELLMAAYDLILDSLDQMNDENGRAYMLDHLRVMIDGQHGMLSDDLNMDKLIERADAYDPDAEDEEDGDDEEEDDEDDEEGE